MTRTISLTTLFVILGAGAAFAQANTTGPSRSDPPTAVTTQPKSDAIAPIAGANSFTETQARSRIEKEGYTNVSGLAKDTNGVWRGKATKNGKTTGVALDFKGNIVVGQK
jgi:putative membrane protein